MDKKEKLAMELMELIKAEQGELTEQQEKEIRKLAATWLLLLNDAEDDTPPFPPK